MLLQKKLPRPPECRNPEPSDPKPRILKPKPQPQAEIPKPQPQAESRKPKPEAQIPKPQTDTRQAETRNLKP